jgi:hypothetical protein
MNLLWSLALLRIQDVYPGSRIWIRIFSIPDTGYASKNFNSKNFFLNSRKYDPGCLSRIRSLIFLPIPRIQELKRNRIPDPDLRTLVSSKNEKMCKQHLESLSPPPPRPPNSELGFAPQNCKKGQTVQNNFCGPLDNDNTIGTYQTHRFFMYVI